MKAAWAWPAQVATWLASLVLLFVVKPPRLEVSDAGPGIDRFIEFALAIIIGIVFAVLPRQPSDPDPDRKRSALASGILLVAAIAAFGLYLYLSGHWTCTYDAGDPMVIGGALLPDAAQYKAQHPELDCAGLIGDFAGQTALIWPRAELINRRLMLSGLFALVVVTFALSALFMLRALTKGPIAEAPAAPAETAA